MNKQILVLLPISETQKAHLESQAPDSTFYYSSPRLVSGEHTSAAQIIIGNLAPSRLKEAGRLEWLQLNSAGYEDYLAPGIIQPGICLTNATGAYGQAVSEHMLAMLLSLIKKLPLYRDNQSRHLWKDEGAVTSIAGARVLIAGAGNIGCCFAGLIKALGGYTIGLKRNTAVKPQQLDEVYTLDRLDALLPSINITASVLPGTPDTFHLFNASRFGLMKPGAILINAGRGSAIDTGALCTALQTGHLSAAGLDVTDPEPLPVDHRLWSIKTALITPHISGQYHLSQTLENIVQITARNLAAYASGTPLHNQCLPSPSAF